MDKLEGLKGSPDIKVITGMRRSGKSVIVRQFMERLIAESPKNNIAFVDFTQLDFEELKDYRKLNAWVEARQKVGYRNYLFIDEVQLCEDFEKTINSLHSKGVFDIYLTGSNAFLQSSDLATLFTGRCMEVKVYPFSFAEFRRYFGYERNKDDAFDDYVIKGGLSGSYVYPNEAERVDNLVETYTTIVERDLIERLRLTNATAMQCIAEYLMDNIGNITSPSSVCTKLASTKVETSHVTTGNYIRALCDAFVFSKCKRYDLKGKKYLETLNKFYLLDHGLRYAMLGRRTMDYGHVYENIVYVELLRRGYEVSIGKLYAKEVDFVATRGSEKLYIQVSDDVSNPETLHRELEPLSAINDAYPRLLIARTRHDETDHAGVKIVDIVRWLAGDESGASVAARIRNRVKKSLENDFRSESDAFGRGTASFDFLANGGKFTIEGLGASFLTEWSAVGADSVHAYKDGVELLGVGDSVNDFPESAEAFERFDFTRRSSVCRKGDVVVFMNKDGRFLAVKILDVKDNSRGAGENRLELAYKVY